MAKMTSPVYTQAAVDPNYRLKNIGAHLLNFVMWALAYLANGGQIPRTTEGWASLILVALTTGLGIQAASTSTGTVAPPK